MFTEFDIELQMLRLPGSGTKSYFYVEKNEMFVEMQEVTEQWFLGQVHSTNWKFHSFVNTSAGEVFIYAPILHY